MNLQEEFKIFKIEKKGIITVTENKPHPKFKLFNPLDTVEGHVYLWVIEVDDKPSQILYIGKAGKTIFIRCAQHTEGFKGGSKRGTINSEKLLQLLNKESSIAIYARESDKLKILGQENISLCDAEEKALIAHYKKTFPLFNKL